MNTTANKFDRFIFLVLLIVTFLTPIFFVPFTFISTQFGTSLIFAFGVIVAVIFYVVGVLKSNSIDLPNPGKYILGLTVLVPVVYVLAGIANGFSRLTFFGYYFDISTVGFILLGFAYLFLVSIIFRNGQRIFYSYFAFLVSAIILSAFLISRIFLGPNFLSFGIFTSLVTTTIGSWNNVGIFFGVGALLSLLTFELAPVSKFMKVLLTVALLLSLFFLALVNLNIIWIIIAICSFLFILYSVFNDGGVPASIFGRLRKIPVYPTIVFIVAVVFVFWGSKYGTFLSSKLQVTNLEIRPSLSTTFEIARNTISNSPLFGSGPNTFINGWLTWKPDDVLSTVFWNLDFTNGIGLIPTFAVTTGLVGILTWILFLGYYLYLGFKSIFARNDDNFKKYLVTSSFFVSFYLWVMAVCYIPSTVIFVLTFFFMGLFFASIYNSSIIFVETKSFSGNPKTGFLSSLVLVSLLLGSLSLGYGLFRSSQSLWYFQKSSYALNTEKKSDLSEKYMLNAIELVPYDVYYRALSEIELVKLNTVASQDVNKVKPEIIQKEFADVLTNAIKAGLSAKDADPSNYLNWISLGKVYEAVSSPNLKIKGAYDGSLSAYTEALRRNPKNPAILVLLSRLSASQGDLNKAKDYAIQAVQIKNNYLDAYFILSQIEVASGNLRGAVDAVTASSVIDPTNPAIFFQLGLLKYNLSDWNGAIVAFEKAISLAKDYANAKYFLGLSYEITNQHEKAIKEFQDLKASNPGSKEVDTILTNLLEGKPIFTNTENKKPEKGKTLPIKEKQ